MTHDSCPTGCIIKGWTIFIALCAAEIWAVSKTTVPAGVSAFP